MIRLTGNLGALLLGVTLIVGCGSDKHPTDNDTCVGPNCAPADTTQTPPDTTSPPDTTDPGGDAGPAWDLIAGAASLQTQGGINLMDIGVASGTFTELTLGSDQRHKGVPSATRSGDIAWGGTPARCGGFGGFRGKRPNTVQELFLRSDGTCSQNDASVNATAVRGGETFIQGEERTTGNPVDVFFQVSSTGAVRTIRDPDGWEVEKFSMVLAADGETIFYARHDGQTKRQAVQMNVATAQVTNVILEAPISAIIRPVDEWDGTLLLLIWGVFRGIGVLNGQACWALEEGEFRLVRESAGPEGIEDCEFQEGTRKVAILDWNRNQGAVYLWDRNTRSERVISDPGTTDRLFDINAIR